jgi:hypothetical protein
MWIEQVATTLLPFVLALFEHIDEEIYQSLSFIT